RPSIPSNPRVRASAQCWPDWYGDCTSPPLPPDGHCALAPSQSPQCDSAVVYAHPCATVESLTRDVYPCSGRVRRDQDKLLLCRRLGGKARVVGVLAVESQAVWPSALTYFARDLATASICRARVLPISAVHRSLNTCQVKPAL